MPTSTKTDLSLNKFVLLEDESILCAGNICYKANTVHKESSKLAMIAGTLFETRQVIFINSLYSASVVWGTGTYSDNYKVIGTNFEFTEEPFKVEIMIDHLLPIDNIESIFHGSYVGVNVFNKMMSDYFHDLIVEKPTERQQKINTVFEL